MEEDPGVSHSVGSGSAKDGRGYTTSTRSKVVHGGRTAQETSKVILDDRECENPGDENQPWGPDNTDVVVDRHEGSLDPEHKGSLDLRRRGSLDPERKGSVDPGCKGSLDPEERGRQSSVVNH